MRMGRLSGVRADRNGERTSLPIDSWVQSTGGKERLLRWRYYPVGAVLAPKSSQVLLRINVHVSCGLDDKSRNVETGWEAHRSADHQRHLVHAGRGDEWPQASVISFKRESRTERELVSRERQLGENKKRYSLCCRALDELQVLTDVRRDIASAGNRLSGRHATRNYHAELVSAR